MRRGLWVSLGLIALTGCQNSDSPVAAGPNAPIVQKQLPVGPPTSMTPTKIAIVVHKGPPITVGYAEPAKAFEGFRDTKHSGSEFDDLPRNFSPDYKARTYETAHMGFGEILYDDHFGFHLVAAMYHEDHADQDRVDELVAAHTDQVDHLLPTSITGKKVSYWFWELENQRLMICKYQTAKEGIQITVAMGDEKVMDGLGISIDQARKDRTTMDESPANPKNPLGALVIHRG